MSRMQGNLLEEVRRTVTRVFRRARYRRYTGPFRRSLTRREAGDLARVLSEVFSRRIGDVDVLDVVELVGYFERRMTGRIAGDVQDYVLNYFMVTTAAGIDPKRMRAHVEIGILFGGGLLLTLHALRKMGSANLVFGIDPLNGYYGDRPDPVTGLRVQASVVERNIRRMRLETSQFRLVAVRSQDAEARDALAGLELASVWIDGDHTYDGVQQDWQLYSPLVARGGYVLFDNYHDGVFPDVDRFIDGDLLPELRDWEVAAKLGRSILMRRL